MQVPDLKFKTLEKKGKLIDINLSEGDLNKVTNLLQKNVRKKAKKKHYLQVEIFSQLIYNCLQKTIIH